MYDDDFVLQKVNHIEGAFLKLFLLRFSAKMKNRLQSTTNTFSTNVQYKKPSSLVEQFLFVLGFENWEKRLKKAP